MSQGIYYPGRAHNETKQTFITCLAKGEDT
jgi:hypothetical protein